MSGRKGGRATMSEPFAFRTPVAIPELGAEAGDWIDYNPEFPDRICVVKRAPHHVAAVDAINRVRSRLALPPVERPRLEVHRG